MRTEQNKTSGTVTFHASHNYGSMLQAYALQQTIKSLGIQNKIINLRSEQQRNLYRNPQDPTSVKQNIKRTILDICFPKYKKGHLEKYKLFENFIENNLDCTQEIKNISKNNELNFDYYITGSDQCWNTRCDDFDWAYYLNFTDSPNKVAYASSIGPKYHTDNSEKIAEYLKDFKYISLRDEGTRDYVQQLTNKNYPVVPDPTLLLTRAQWENIIDSRPIITGKYIFLYCPYNKPDIYRVAEYLAGQLNLPIVISNLINPKIEIKLRMRGGLITHFATGPCEFLNLINHATVVLSGSFHALIFSVLFQTPVWAFNGNHDLRMRQILHNFGLENRAISLTDMRDKANYSLQMDVSKIDNALYQQREIGIKYLTSAFKDKDS